MNTFPRLRIGWVVAAILLTAALPPRVARAAPLAVAGLRCESREDPVGVDLSQPRLGWLLESDERGQRQSAYQILVASSADALAADNGDLWDSGRVTSPQSIQIPYGGKPLASFQRSFWKVRTWDKAGQPSAWGAPAAWTTGLLRPSDWTAKWVGSRLEAPSTRPAHRGPQPAFRKEFTLAKTPTRATIFACGLGHFDLSVNGSLVGDDVLQPGWTDYKKTCLYVGHDVTDRLRRGANAVGVVLGNGMYYSGPGRYAKWTGSFGPPVLAAQLVIEYADGTSERITTDASWKTAPSPVTFSSVYGGEDYDARLEQPGWDAPGFDDAKWSPAIEQPGPGGALRGLSGSAAPVRVAHVFDAVSVGEPRPGVFVYDLGQNASMVPRVTVRGPAGAAIKLTPAELLNPDGTASQRSSGGPAFVTYTLRGGRGVVGDVGDRSDGGVGFAGVAGGGVGASGAAPGGASAETWSPRFFYYGSRYVQVEGAVAPGSDNPRGLPVVERLQGVFVTSSAHAAGTFACSNELFNRTAAMIDWAIRSNAQSILTDCPHREKLGWLEEDHLMGPSLMYDRDMSGLFAKACNDMRDAQADFGLVPNIAPEYAVFADKKTPATRNAFGDSPEWGSACVLVPWQLYEWYGDVSALDRNYDMMRRYVDYLGTRADRGVIKYGLGDWYDLGPKRPGVAQLTPVALTATAFYYRDLRVVEQSARLLGKAADADALGRRAADVAAAFNTAFYHADTHQYATGSQTANAIPLVMGLAPDADRAAVVENLVRDVRKRDNGLTAGDVGYRYLLRALADGGRSDVIFDMNSRADRPGYGMILAKGATALTEAWDADPRSSHNHFMLGHILEWFYGDLAGIAPDIDSTDIDPTGPASPGYARIRIRPTPVGDVTWARATYQSVRGPISTSWRSDPARFTLEVTIPPNTTATVWVPATESDKLTEGGQQADQSAGVKPLPREVGYAVFHVESGRYSFAATHPPAPTRPASKPATGPAALPAR